MLRKKLSLLFLILLDHTIDVSAFSGAASSSSSFVLRKPLPVARTASIFGRHNHHYHHRRRQSSQSFSMRDASASYWFQVGDTVRVVADDVVKAGSNLHNRMGTVLETWEKCDVDPTCCCAEQVDVNMAVRVEFMGTEEDPTAADASFLHYFAEDELIKEVVEPTDKATSAPFDGMSCTAFKLDHLQSVGQKPRGIANWEPVTPTSNEKVEEPTNEATSAPFDGMSCTAFKLDHLQSAGQKPRGIANWEPATQQESQSDN